MRSLSIVIPAYNEEARLPATLQAVQRYLDARRFEYVEVIVVDDGSTDGTSKAVRTFAISDPRVRLLENGRNRGKGYAVRRGMREAQGEWVLFSDADLSAPIEELDTLAAVIGEEGADGAIGSRGINRSLIGERQSIIRELIGRVFNRVMRLVTRLPYRDTQCGFKIFRADVARAISTRQQSEGFGFDVEILYIAKKGGFRIVEVPVRWFNVQGSKVSFWNGIGAFSDPLRVRWNDLRGLYEDAEAARVVCLDLVSTRKPKNLPPDAQRTGASVVAGDPGPN